MDLRPDPAPAPYPSARSPLAEVPKRLAQFDPDENSSIATNRVGARTRFTLWSKWPEEPEGLNVNGRHSVRNACRAAGAPTAQADAQPPQRALPQRTRSWLPGGTQTSTAC